VNIDVRKILKKLLKVCVSCRYIFLNKNIKNNILIMSTLISEKDWIGLTIAEAINKAKSIDFVHRIVEEDGRSLVLPYDNKSNRINLRLKDNKVIGVYTG